MRLASGKRDWATLGLIGVISLFWGMNWPAVKIILGQVPPLTMRAAAFTVAAVLILGIAAVTGRSIKVAREEIPALIGGGLCNVLMFNMCTAFGQLSMATSRAAVIAFTMPVWVTLLAIPLLGQWPGRRQIAGLVCGMAGLAVLLGPQGFHQGVGPLFMIVAAVSWALGTIIMKRRVWRTPSLVVTGWQYVLSALPMILAAAWTETPPAIASLRPDVWVALAWHLTCSICLAQVLWYVVVRRATVAEAAIGTLLIPVVGVSGSLALLGETLTLRLAVALGLILVAVAAVLLPGRQLSRT